MFARRTVGDPSLFLRQPPDRGEERSLADLARRDVERELTSAVIHTPPLDRDDRWPLGMVTPKLIGCP
jgi:hypothetical protein